jgi:hypothetical protein
VPPSAPPPAPPDALLTRLDSLLQELERPLQVRRARYSPRGCFAGRMTAENTQASTLGGSGP